MFTNREHYIIVVVGSMNPRIHTPAWYRLVELIDQAELDEATANPQAMVNVAISQWQIKDISVLCTIDRWEIRTTNIECLERLRTMTADVFDKKLEQTPVAALGFNFNYDRVTEVADLGRYLASRVAITQMGLRNEGLVSGELTLKQSLDGRSRVVGIRPLDEKGCESVVSVFNNFEYRFASDKSGYFRIKDTLSARFLEDLRDAQEQVSRVVQAINQSGEP
jgi:hypothetical protein